MKSQLPPYVAMPMRMFAYDTEFFATNDEFLVFYHICTMVTARDTNFVRLNIELLNSIIKPDPTNQSRGKKRIKSAILGLQSKKYIKLDHAGIEVSNYELLNITTPDLQHCVYKDDVRNSRSTFTGYTPITDELFAKCSTVNELKVLTYVIWRSRIAYEISYHEWASVLDVSYQTAVKIISACVQKNIIVKLRGDYYSTLDGQIRQETNRYFTPAEKPDNSIKKEVHTAQKSMENGSKSKETRSHNWFTDNFIDANDMYVYLTTTCEVLMIHADKRLEGIRKSPSGQCNIEKRKKEAEKRIEQEKQQKHAELVHQARSMNNHFIDDLLKANNYDFEEAYRKARKSVQQNNDFSYLLGNN